VGWKLVSLTALTHECSGGTKGWPEGACVPAVNPCAPAGKPSSFHSVMRHQFYHISHQQRPTFLRSLHRKSEFWKQIF